VAPASCAVPTLLPIGCGGPAWLPQIMSSAAFCPDWLGLGSYHRSYEAFQAPPPVVVYETLLETLPKLLTCNGRPLPELQLP
jgi:hypothetical protein